MTEQELKACPFCGSEAWVSWMMQHQWHKVECSNQKCGACIVGHNHATAKRRWNRRTRAKQEKES